MKKLILLLSIIGLLVSCTSTPQTEEELKQQGPKLDTYQKTFYRDFDIEYKQEMYYNLSSGLYRIMFVQDTDDNIWLVDLNTDEIDQKWIIFNCSNMMNRIEPSKVDEDISTERPFYRPIPDTFNENGKWYQYEIDGKEIIEVFRDLNYRGIKPNCIKIVKDGFESVSVYYYE